MLEVGPSDSGKTAPLNLIAGLLAPTAGGFIEDGQDLVAIAPAARNRFRGWPICHRKRVASPRGTGPHARAPWRRAGNTGGKSEPSRDARSSN